jgi:hypothetical protein
LGKIASPDSIKPALSRAEAATVVAKTTGAARKTEAIDLHARKASKTKEHPLNAMNAGHDLSAVNKGRALSAVSKDRVKIVRNVPIKGLHAKAMLREVIVRRENRRTLHNPEILLPEAITSQKEIATIAVEADADTPATADLKAMKPEEILRRTIHPHEKYRDTHNYRNVLGILRFA